MILPDKANSRSPAIKHSNLTPRERLNVLIICAFDKQAVRKDFGLPSDPLAILAVGKGAESIFLKPVEAGEDLKYYRVDGVHFVPKIKEEDLLL